MKMILFKKMRIISCSRYLVWELLVIPLLECRRNWNTGGVAECLVILPRNKQFPVPLDRLRKCNTLFWRLWMDSKNQSLL